MISTGQLYTTPHPFSTPQTANPTGDLGIFSSKWTRGKRVPPCGAAGPFFLLFCIDKRGERNKEEKNNQRGISVCRQAALPPLRGSLSPSGLSRGASPEASCYSVIVNHAFGRAIRWELSQKTRRKPEPLYPAKICRNFSL